MIFDNFSVLSTAPVAEFEISISSLLWTVPQPTTYKAMA